MNDRQLLDQLGAEDPVRSDGPLTSAAWDREVAFARVESLVGLDAQTELTRRLLGGDRRVGWLVAAVAFAVVIVTGLIAAFVTTPGGTNRPVATTSAPVPSTAPPTTLSATTVSPTTSPDDVPETALQLITEFHTALSAGDISAAEALFAPGGEYQPTEAADVFSSGWYPESTIVGQGDLPDYLRFWYAWLGTNWTPLNCNGDATKVTCTVESSGLTTLFLPGGVARGFVTYTLSPDGIVSVLDRTVRTGGASTGFEDGLDLRGFWRSSWIADNQPEIESLWPEGNGDPVSGFSLEMAEAIIEFYPVFLADRGINVPSEYLDGSIVDALTEQ